MTTPSSDIGVTMLAGAALDAAIASVQTGPAAASLWQDLRASGYSPQLSYAAGAKVAQHSTGRGYTYVSVPFANAKGATARLVWDDVMGSPRAAYGLPAVSGGSVSRVDVHQDVNGRVQHAYSLVRDTAQDVELQDGTGHVLQRFPISQLSQRTGGLAAEVSASCSACEVLVDILYGVVACGGVAQYFLCELVCSALTALVGAVLCAIACGVFVGLCCYLSGNLLKQVTCESWCG